MAPDPQTGFAADEAARFNRPGLSQIRFRAGTHGSFLAAMAAQVSRRRLHTATRLRLGKDQDAAVALLDAWASICDVLTFYQERIANEGYLRTAVERRSVLELARLTGYRLRPGVAADVHLAFTVEGDDPVPIPVGTRVQSVPGPSETARGFELTESVEARSELNLLRIRTTRATQPVAGLSRFVAAGVATGLRIGDAILVEANGSATLRRVESVAQQFDQQRTVVALRPVTSVPAAPADGSPASTPAAAAAPIPPPDPDDWVAEQLRDHLMAEGDVVARLADGLQSRLASAGIPRLLDPSLLQPQLARVLAPGSDIAMRLRASSFADPDDMYVALSAVGGPVSTPLQVHAMRLHTAPFGAAAPRSIESTGGRAAFHEWQLASGPDGERPNVLFLEAPNETIVPGSWVAFDAPPGIAVPPPRHVLAAGIVSRAEYGVVGRCTRLELDGPWIDPAAEDFAKLRSLSVYAASTPLSLLPEDDDTPLAVTDHLELDGVYQGLSAGRRLIVEGELPAVPGPQLSEVVMLAGSEQRLDDPAPATGAPVGRGSHSRFRTVLTLAQPTSRVYRRGTLKIYGNVAAASEGTSVEEVLGSGDGSRAWQSFTLKKPPLTFVSAATPTGAVSTLVVTVNGVHWHEVGSLVGAGPEDRVFVTETADDGVVTVRFGNGINGARLPSGTENVLASYRTGLGKGGNCQDRSITMLLTRPLGVRDVTNPLPASGGADPEDRDQARRNAVVGVVALDRLVGTRDYQDFARAFAGIGKADAVHLFGAEGPTMLVTVAGRDGPFLRDGAPALRTLQAALDQYGDPSHTTIVKAARYLRVLLVASVALAPDYVWSATATALRRALLDRFGYPCRELGQSLHRSEVMAAMHGVDGVAAVFIRVFASLPEPITQDVLNRLLANPPLADVAALPGRMGIDHAGTRRRMPLPADLAFIADDMPELMLLTEAVT